MFIITAVNMFFQAVVYLILGRAIASWFMRPGDRLYPLFRILCQITEPILEPCRRITERFGISRTMDFSPVIAIILLWGINWVVIELLKIIIF